MIIQLTCPQTGKSRPPSCRVYLGRKGTTPPRAKCYAKPAAGFTRWTLRLAGWSGLSRVTISVIAKAAIQQVSKTASTQAPSRPPTIRGFTPGRAEGYDREVASRLLSGRAVPSWLSRERSRWRSWSRWRWFSRIISSTAWDSMYLLPRERSNTQVPLALGHIPFHLPQFVEESVFVLLPQRPCPLSLKPTVRTCSPHGDPCIQMNARLCARFLHCNFFPTS
jgi:hypothetical protein